MTKSNATEYNPICGGLRIQYKTGTGSFGDCWADCSDGVAIVSQAAEFNSATLKRDISVEMVMKDLARGCVIEYAQHDFDGSYEIRAEGPHEKFLADARKKRDEALDESAGLERVCSVCGCLGDAGQYPFSTIPNGDTCDDCL